MLHVASVCAPCCMLLDVAACCCAKFETSQTFQPTTPNIPFVPWSPKRSATMLDQFGQLFQQLLPRMLIMHGLQRLMGCILPTMYCRSQHCWQLLHLFAHRCQHARNKSQHCWRNNVGSCCVRSHATLESKGLYFNAYVHTITLLLYLCMIIFFSILLQYFLACLWLK